MTEINKIKAGLKIGVTENIEKHGNSFIHKSLCDDMPYEYIDYSSGPTTFNVDFVTRHYAYITSTPKRLHFVVPLEVLTGVSFEIEEIKLKTAQWGITNEDLKTIPNNVSKRELTEVIKNAQDVAVARQALVCLLYMLRNGHKAVILADPFNDDVLNTLYTALYDEIEDLNKNKLKP